MRLKRDWKVLSCSFFVFFPYWWMCISNCINCNISLRKMRGLWNNSVIHFNTHKEQKLINLNSLLCLLCFFCILLHGSFTESSTCNRNVFSFCFLKNISLLKSLYKPLLRKEPDVVRKSLLWNFKRSEWKNEKALPHSVFASLSCYISNRTYKNPTKTKTHLLEEQIKICMWFSYK